MKKKILHLIPSLSPLGGIENYTLNLLKTFDTNVFIHEVIAFRNENNDVLSKFLNERGIKIHSLSKGISELIINKNLKGFVRNIFIDIPIKLFCLNKLLKSIEPNLCIVHGVENELLIALSKIKVNKFLVIHSHALYPKNYMYRSICKIARKKKYLKTIAVSKSLLSNIKVNSVFIQTGIIRSSFPPKVSFSPGKNISIGYIGRIEVEKGVFKLLKLFGGFINNYNIQLSFTGSGRSLAKLKSVVSKLEFKNSIIFNDAVLDMNSIYDKLDILVLLSDTEACPLTIIEAMNKGVCIIANNVGGIEDLITEYNKGFIVEKNTLDEAKTILAEILDKKYYLLQPLMGNQILENSSIEKMTKEYENLFTNYFIEHPS